MAGYIVRNNVVQVRFLVLPRFLVFAWEWRNDLPASLVTHRANLCDEYQHVLTLLVWNNGENTRLQRPAVARI